MERPASKAGIDVTLRCPVTKEDFIFTAPRDPAWLSQHWSRKAKIRCRECGGAHGYSLRAAYLTEALKTRPIFEGIEDVFHHEAHAKYPQVLPQAQDGENV
jgi:hypothetical protein